MYMNPTPDRWIFLFHRLMNCSRPVSLLFLIFILSHSSIRAQEKCKVCSVPSFAALTVYHTLQTGSAMGFGIEAGKWKKDDGKFSYFLELYKAPELRDWVSRSPEALDDFVQWVGTNKIARGQDVRELRDIVTNARALAAFSAHGREAALKVLEKDRPELTSPLFKLMIEMTEALNDSRLDEIQRVRKDKTGGARTIVRNLVQSLERFVDLCDGLD